MSRHTFSSLTVRFLLGVAAVAVAVAGTQAGDPPAKFLDGAARQMLSQLKAGEGWAVVSERANVKLLAEGPAVDCVKYRVVTNYTSGTSNDQFFLAVEYSAETPWISLEFKMPAASGTSLSAAKRANEVVGELDTFIAGLEAPVASEEDAAVRALGQKLLGVLKGQRAALVDLIQKDIQAIK